MLRLGAVSIDGAKESEPDLEARQAHRDPHLDAAARSLFELLRAEPNVVWSIATPESWLGIPDPEEVDLLISDVGRRNVAYTHDTAAAHRLGELGVADPLVWLSEHGSAASGVLLSDRAGEYDGLPPGAGGVDWPAVVSQVGSGMLRTLVVDSRHSAAVKFYSDRYDYFGFNSLKFLDTLDRHSIICYLNKSGLR